MNRKRYSKDIEQYIRGNLNGGSGPLTHDDLEFLLKYGVRIVMTGTPDQFKFGGCPIPEKGIAKVAYPAWRIE